MSDTSEEWRHACEVRYIVNLPTLKARREMLRGIELKRGKGAADRLRAALLTEWENRKNKKEGANAQAKDLL